MRIKRRLLTITAILIWGITPTSLLAQSDNKLAVVITSSASSPEELPQIRGHYIYVSEGKEIKEKIDKNGWGYNFEGEYIKEVMVQKSGGGGSYQLFVMEDDSLLFESGTMTTPEPVIYRKR